MKRTKLPGWKIAKIEWNKHLKKRLLKRRAADKMARKTRKQQRRAS